MTVAKPLEPHQDHRTIGSYKRTFNAAVLLYAARPRATEPAARPFRRLLLYAVAALIGAVAPEISSHIE